MWHVRGDVDVSAQKSKRTKKCRNCGSPVRKTQGNAGYCKRCIKKALEEQNARAEPDVQCGICGTFYTRQGVGDDCMCPSCGNALLDSNERLSRKERRDNYV